MWLIFLVLIAFVVCLYMYGRKYADVGGPPGLPFIGNILQLDPKSLHHTLEKWARQYGDIYKFTAFGSETVVVSGQKGIQDVLVKQSAEFAGRPPMFRMNYLYGDDVASRSLSSRVAMIKKHCMTSLKQVGDGVERLEQVATDMLEQMVTSIEGTSGQPFNPRPLIHEAISGINATMIFGWKLSDEEEAEILHCESTIVQLFFDTAGMILDKFPWLCHLPNKHFDKLKSISGRMYGVISPAVEKTVHLTESNEEYQTALQDLIKTYKKEKDHQKITMQTLKNISAELIIAGNISTSASLVSLIALLANNLTLQEQCQAEVDNVLGNRAPTLADKASLPFVDSLMLELLRFISHVPVLAPHMSTKDTQLLGRFIPKDTEVWINAWTLHHDPALWEEPWTFKPDRFLSEERHLLPPDHEMRKRLFPFGAGTRVCVGQVMAKNRLFLFICTLLQRFTFLPESTEASLPADPRTWMFGIAIMPPDFKIRAIPRQ